MNDILERLYCGEINPSDEIGSQTELFREISSKHSEAEERFMAGLTSSQLEEYEKLKEIQIEYERQYELLHFQTGFRVGMQLTMAGLK